MTSTDFPSKNGRYYYWDEQSQRCVVADVKITGRAKKVAEVTTLPEKQKVVIPHDAPKEPVWQYAPPSQRRSPDSEGKLLTEVISARPARTFKVPLPAANGAVFTGPFKEKSPKAVSTED